MSAEHAHVEDHGAHAPAHDAHAHGHEAANDNVEHGAHPLAHAAHGHEAANDNVEHDAAHGAHPPAHGSHGHKAANDNVEHGAEHGAHAPAHGAHPPVGGKSPIIALRDSVLDIGSSIVNNTKAVGDGINKYLNTDDLETGSDRKSLIETPFYAAGHIIEGTALNAARRSMEVISPICSFVRAAVSTTVGTILKPSNLKNGKTKNDAVEMVKSVGMLGKNILMAAPRAASEFADFAIDRTVQQISTQIERVPVVGKLISGPLKWISNKVKNAVNAVTNVADLITSPLGGKSGHADAHGHGGGHDTHGGHDDHGGHDAHGGHH